MSYITTAHTTYGNKCEWIGCGWESAACDVHHINYQDQQGIEAGLRAAYKSQAVNMIDLYEKKREELGFLPFDHKVNQLPKDDRSTNLTVLCPNHHRFVHGEDLGMKILQYIPERK